MQSPIFRKVALERLSSPEQLDQLIQITTPKGWLALLGLLLIVVTAVVWSILGSIPTQIGGQGILFNSGAVHSVAATVAGQVLDVPVQVGDLIETGQTIATVRQPGQDATAEIGSLFGGRVIELRAATGDVLELGTPVLVVEDLEAEARPLQVIAYLPAAEGKQIMPGMDAQIAPATVNVNETGYLLGRVSSVSHLPVSMQGIRQVLGSDSLAQLFAGVSVPIEVQIDLISDPQSASGYQWSGAAPDVIVEEGTPGTVLITISEQRPINLILGN